LKWDTGVIGNFISQRFAWFNFYFMKNLLSFLTIMFAVITLGALLAHLFELPRKMMLSKEDYQVVQGIYSGWAWLGIFEIGTILLTLIWMISERKKKPIFPSLLTALLLFVISLAIFFLFTFPANQATINWTHLPDAWETLRIKWEYSHGIRAVLNLIGFGFLIAALMKKSH